MRRIATVAALASLVLLAGCLGLGGEDGGDEVQQNEAVTTDDTGGIEGLVTDEAVQPRADVTVTLPATGEETTTGEDGSYAFSKVEPGEHTLVFDREDLVSVEETVTVAAGDVAKLDVVMADTVEAQAFTQDLELVGFIECGVGWTTDPDPAPGLTSNALAACSVPQILSENSTNDKFLHSFDLEPPIESLVYQMRWDGESTALSTQMEVQGFPFAEDAEILREEGTPPLDARLDRATFDELAGNFTERCEGANDTEQSDAYCGYNFAVEGWPMQTRVFVDSSCNELPARACTAVQQEFTHRMSAFYHDPAPDGFDLST
jgi:hypothetical protein